MNQFKFSFLIVLLIFLAPAITNADPNQETQCDKFIHTFSCFKKWYGEHFSVKSNPDRNIETTVVSLGYLHSLYASPQPIVRGRPAEYSFPMTQMSKNQWALQGSWIISPQYIVSSQAGAILQFHFDSKKVLIVMGSVNGKKIPVKLLLNDQEIIEEKGKDVVNSEILVGRPQLYEAIDLKEPSSGILQLISLEPGLIIYSINLR